MLGFAQRRHGPVVDQQHIDAGEPRQQAAQAAAGAAAAKSRNRLAARVYSAEYPSRQAFCASALARKLLPTPVGPSTKTFWC